MEDFKEERYVDTSIINRVFKGKIIKEVEGLNVGDDSIRLTFDNGFFDMYHSQDCCESVDI